MESDDGDRIRLTVPATPAAARITRVGVAGLATRAGFTYREVEQLRLAVDEAASLLVGGPAAPAPRARVDERLVVVYLLSRDGLSVEMRVEGRAEGSVGDTPATPVSDLAARVLDASVDAWEASTVERRVVLQKQRTDVDDDDDE